MNDKYSELHKRINYTSPRNTALSTAGKNYGFNHHDEPMSAYDKLALEEMERKFKENKREF